MGKNRQDLLLNSFNKLILSNEQDLKNHGWKNAKTLIDGCGAEKIEIVMVLDDVIEFQNSEGVPIYLHKGFYEKLLKNKNGITMEELFRAINETPTIFKQDIDHIGFELTDESSAYNYGNVRISSKFLENPRDNSKFIVGTIIHEIAHNFDMRGKGASTKKEMELLVESARSFHPKFRKLLNQTVVGVDSMMYKINDDPTYYSESLSELMKIVGKAHLYPNGKESIATIWEYDVELGGYGPKNIPYAEWVKTHKELAKLGEELWYAKTEEDVERAFNNINI